jgi:hypothetical protein
MNTFVLIFRQGPRPLMGADKRCSVEETAAWARAQDDAGHKLDSRTLTPEGAHRGPDGDELGNRWPITALLFFEAIDLCEAVKIAEAHPALRYGASAEVRHWTPQVGVPTSTGHAAAPAADSGNASRGVVRVPWETVPWVRLGA